MSGMNGKLMIGKKFKCFIHAGGGMGRSEFHLDDCKGEFIMMESKYGAITSNCEKGWKESGTKGWVEIVGEQEIEIIKKL